MREVQCQKRIDSATRQVHFQIRLEDKGKIDFFFLNLFYFLFFPPLSQAPLRVLAFPPPSFSSGNTNNKPDWKVIRGEQGSCGAKTNELRNRLLFSKYCSRSQGNWDELFFLFFFEGTEGV